jgi:predicted ATPase/signal transduction histidine kinase
MDSTLLYESQKSKIYLRKQDDQWNQPTVLKVLNYEYPSPTDIAHFYNEQEILNGLNLCGVRRVLERTKENNRHAMILEWVEGKNIHEAFREHRSDIARFLRVAIALTDILAGLHQHNIIHKDISSFNIIANTEDSSVFLIDFGIATNLDLKHTYLGNPERLEGNLRYISPEQSGRMNRVVDFRSDLYSLGVVLYETLAGVPPFAAEDAMELIHAHIAHVPVPLAEMNPAVPSQISRIIAKLLAKNAEDRYQSALGVKADLERCLSDWERGQAIEAFPLAAVDFSGKFIISQKLYGREKEIEQILNTFNACADGSLGLMLVGGYSGTGKSALVHEVHKPITERYGYFASGKFDQFQRAVPYSAMLDAFKELITILLTESEEKLAIYKERIQDAIGEEGQVLTNVLPTLEYIIGTQMPVPEVGGAEAQHRFHYVVQKFVHALCTAEHPVVLFIDDLQWADAASLNLLKALMNDVDGAYLLVICAYRDNEVSASHPFMMLASELQTSVPTYVQLAIKNLALSDVERIIAASVGQNRTDVGELATLVFEKTLGNAFFVTQFLKSLAEERLLTFDFSTSLWQWEIETIRTKNITDNVVELMSSKILRLPSDEQEILKRGACLGSSFDLETVVLLVQDGADTAVAGIEHLRQKLYTALRKGYIQPLEENRYKFAHDRIQQAIYGLIDAAKREESHIAIGRLLLARLSESEVEKRLFDIVNQCNSGLRCVSGEQEKERLAWLNHRAGVKAKLNSAFAPALEYFEMGIQLLREGHWHTQYDLAFALHIEAAELAYLNADIAKMDIFLTQIFNHAQTLGDKSKGYEIQILGYISESKLREALGIGANLLKQFGVQFPKKPTTLHAVASLLHTKLVLVGKSLEEIEHLPPVHLTEKNKNDVSAMEILSQTLAAAYWTQPNLLLMMVMKLIRLSVKNGTSPVSVYAYATYGVILCDVGMINEGYEFGQLSRRMAVLPAHRVISCKTLFTFPCFIQHWKEPLQASLPLLLEAYHAGLETGDVEFGTFAYYFYCHHQFHAGVDLPTCLTKMSAAKAALVQARQTIQLDYLLIQYQAVLNLTGESQNPCALEGEMYKESEMLALHERRHDYTALFKYHFQKSILLYLFGDYEAALQHNSTALGYVKAVTGLYIKSLVYFYHALTRIALHNSLSGTARIENALRIRVAMGKVRRWAKSSPENFAHKILLLEAEWKRVQYAPVSDSSVPAPSRKPSSLLLLHLYQEAIELAQRSGFKQEEALANELAGQYCLQMQNPAVAELYLRNAYRVYKEWGAVAKCKDVERRFSQFVFGVHTVGTSLARTLLGANQNSIQTTMQAKMQSTLQTTMQRTMMTTTSHIASDVLDITSILKASTAIVSEVGFARLLGVMMRIVMENAGAQRGVFLLEQTGELWIQAERSISEQNEQLSLERVRWKNVRTASNIMPDSVLQFVQRSKKVVVVDNAAEDKRFNADAYILAHTPQSILCLPILSQGKLLGILYLEHRSTTGAFTSNRVELLSLLSGQIAVSLANSLAYEQLEQKVAERTQELAREKKNIELANGELSERNRQLQSTMNDLKQMQGQLIQSEKMASLGVLTAGVAHEINNPINFVSGSIEPLERNVKAIIATLNKFNEITPDKLSVEHLDEIRTTLAAIHEEQELKRLPKMMSQVPTLFKAISNGAERVIEIVRGLQSFSRLDESALKMMSVNGGLDSTLVILQSQFKERAIHIEKNYGEIPEIECYPGRINQVFMNILANALHAIPKEKSDGAVYISTRCDVEIANMVEIRIRDNGVGMSEAVRKSIFDPFFTTKKVGEGTGLGLSIVLGIIEKHFGTITVESAPNEGTEFCIRLPIQQR